VCISGLAFRGSLRFVLLAILFQKASILNLSVSICSRSKAYSSVYQLSQHQAITIESAYGYQIRSRYNAFSQSIRSRDTTSMCVFNSSSDKSSSLIQRSIYRFGILGSSGFKTALIAYQSGLTSRPVTYKSRGRCLISSCGILRSSLLG
jgi:hypothetical protein